MLVKKWSEALVLYERVLKYAKEVQSKAKSLNNRFKVGQTGEAGQGSNRPPQRVHAASHPPLQDLPDVQELIAEVNAEKYSLQAAAILGEAAALQAAVTSDAPAVFVVVPQRVFVFQTRTRRWRLRPSSK